MKGLVCVALVARTPDVASSRSRPARNETIPSASTAYRLRLGLAGWESRCRFDQREAGASRCQACQAAMTGAAAVQGHERKPSARAPAAAVRNGSDLTAPKLPPPPRGAQKR